jgi:hypothetical protein
MEQKRLSDKVKSIEKGQDLGEERLELMGSAHVDPINGPG